MSYSEDGEGDPVQPTLAQLSTLTGRVAVVTGAGAGVGAAIARRLAEAGASVVVADIDGAAAQAVAAALDGSGPAGSAVAHQVDVTSEDSITALLGAVTSRFGRLDAWVNNVGVYPRDDLLTMPRENWQRVLDVNLSGTFLCSRAAARAMIDLGGPGVIVNLASLSAFRAPLANMTHYVASKAGVVGLTHSLAVELGPHGIRVVGVAPAFVPTETAVALLAEDGVHDPVPRYAARMPLRRVLDPDDVARVVYFAVSDLASMVSGSTLLVDGGQLSG
jgi:NAD(P)-dependent dehydrogenase (short-subunit alcohol dehydrogenase family)